MAIATDQQFQSFMDTKIRVFCDQACKLNQLAEDIVSLGDDIYSAATQQSPTWVDNRTDGPPRLGTPADFLSVNAFLHSLISFIGGEGNFATVEKLRVN